MGTVSLGGDLAMPPSENLASWSAMLGPGIAVEEGLGLGGHSRFSFCSIFSASPDALFCDVTLEVRGGLLGTIDWRLVCCSKRPIRFATLCLGRSSGNGLNDTRAVVGSVGSDTGGAMYRRTCCYDLLHDVPEDGYLTYAETRQ